MRAHRSTGTSKSLPGTIPGRDFPTRTSPDGKPPAFPASGRGLPAPPAQDLLFPCSRKFHVALDTISHWLGSLVPLLQGLGAAHGQSCWTILTTLAHDHTAKGRLILQSPSPALDLILGLRCSPGWTINSFPTLPIHLLELRPAPFQLRRLQKEPRGRKDTRKGFQRQLNNSC